MANPKEPRLVKWRGYWYVFSFDWVASKPTRTPCAKFNANTKAERNHLIKRLKEKELRERAFASHMIGGNDFKLKLPEALKKYLNYVGELVEGRIANPDARTGISLKESKDIEYTLNSFMDWLRDEDLIHITCGRLDAAILNRFFNWVVSTPFYPGGSGKPRARSATTVNNYRKRIRTCLRWLDMQRPRLFPDFILIAPALKSRGVSLKPALAFSHDELIKFQAEALKATPKATVKRVKNGRKEVFKQAAGAPSTSVDSLFLLLACTGMRLGEALSLKWSDLDFGSGRIVINAQKTGAWRMIPLTNAPECEVAPGFIKTLKQWRKERPDDEYVLPYDGLERPVYPKQAWQRVRNNSGADITPQKLRQNFVSYCASMGVPPAIAAMWCGHSAQVAERHYRLQLMGRKKAKSIQGAMGL